MLKNYNVSTITSKIIAKCFFPNFYEKKKKKNKSQAKPQYSWNYIAWSVSDGM